MSKHGGYANSNKFLQRNHQRVWVIRRKSRPQLPVGRTLCSIYKFISQTLSYRLDVPKSRFPSTCSKQVNSLIHTAKWRNIHGLTPDNPSRADTCSILPWPTVVTEVLNRNYRTSCKHEKILVKGPEKNQYFIISIPVDYSINNNLDGIQVSQQVNNFHCVLYNPHCHQLFPIVSPMHHQGVCKPLHNWALGLTEALDRVSPSSMWDIGCMLGCNHTYVITQRYVANLQTILSRQQKSVDKLRITNLMTSYTITHSSLNQTCDRQRQTPLS